MRILITGGSGFFGKSLLSYILKNTKDDVFTLSRSPNEYYQHFECDLTDVKRTKEVLEIVKPEIVFHLSGIPHVKPNEENPSKTLIDNISSTHNLIHNLKNKPRVVFSSSVTVFGFFSKRNPCWWNSETHPISLYATSKLACENIIRVYHTEGKINGTSIRIPALTGVGATHGLIKDLITKLESDNKTLNLFGVKPGSIKPFMAVDDCSAIFYKIATEQKGYDEVGLTSIVGTKDSLSVLQIANIVMEELNIKKEICWDENSVWAGDNKEIYIIPCFSPISNSEESIRKVIREYKNAKV